MATHPFPGRAELERSPHTVLKDEGEGAARVVRYDLPDGPVVLKEWLPRRSRLLAWWARTQMRREIAHYRLLEGTPGIPRFRASYGDSCLVIDFVEGVPFRRRVPRELLEAGLEGLQRTLEAVHARGFVHLDLHQRLNALIAPGGQVWLIDLGQGLDCSRGWLRRLIFPWLVRIDRRALVKFRARYAPETLDERVREHLVRRHAHDRSSFWKRLLRRLRKLLVGSSS